MSASVCCLIVKLINYSLEKGLVMCRIRFTYDFNVFGTQTINGGCLFPVYEQTIKFGMSLQRC